MFEETETVVKPEDQVEKKKADSSNILLFALYGLTILLIVLVLMDNWKSL